MSYLPNSQVINYTLPLSGVVDTIVPLTGTFIVKATGLTADDATDYTISNQHVWILVNTVSLPGATGTITITGTSLSESTAVPVPADTEVITIDSTADTYYQTHKKWWQITNIDVDLGGDVTSINYDHGVLGYPDLGNKDFKILGYRCDAFSAGVSADFRIIISRVRDLGDKKVDFIDLEDIGIDSGSGGNDVVDHVRTGAEDRTYAPDVDIWLNDETLTLKQLDFDSYWGGDNEIFAENNDEGFFIRIEGEGGGISNVDYIALMIYYKLL